MLLLLPLKAERGEGRPELLEERGVARPPAPCALNGGGAPGFVEEGQGQVVLAWKDAPGPGGGLWWYVWVRGVAQRLLWIEEARDGECGGRMSPEEEVMPPPPPPMAGKAVSSPSSSAMMSLRVE